MIPAIGARRRTGPGGGLDLEALTQRRQITATGSLLTGAFYPSSGAAQTYEYTHTTVTDAQTLIAYVDAQVAGGTLTLTIEGATHRVTFSGSPTFTIAGGWAPVASDPVDIAIPAGTAIIVRLHYEAVGVQHRAAKTLGVYPSARWGTGDLTADGVGIVDHNNTQRMIPTVVSITGLTRPHAPVVLGIGDSIFESGSGNPSGYSLGVRGAGLAFVNAGRWAGSTVAQGDPAIGSLDHFTHVLDEYGFNDLTNEAVTKTMADKLLTWAWAHGQNAALKITACTVTPSASSTDGWTTLPSQAPDAGTTYGGLTRHQRTVAYNGWLRDGAPILAGVAAPGTTDPAALRAGDDGHPLAGYLDIADVIESSRDSGIFRVDHGALAVDGVHMNSTAGALIATVVQAWAETLTA